MEVACDSADNSIIAPSVSRHRCKRLDHCGPAQILPSKEHHITLLCVLRNWWTTGQPEDGRRSSSNCAQVILVSKATGFYVSVVAKLSDRSY